MPLFADRYELGPLIGQGGMAEVRAGHDTRLERPVAIKIMRLEVAHQPLVRDRFESEARLAARLMHPNVVSVFDSGEEEGLPYIVMERLPGDTLHDRLAQGPMPEPEVRQLALEVLAALESAHAAGILHRDIKPANVLSSGDGHWKVTDFGIAKALEVDRGDATATGLVLGTPAYLAPERLLGEPATVASDIYALGATLYEALAGRRPFEQMGGPGAPPGESRGAAGGWPAVLSGAALVPLSAIRPATDQVLARAVERCLDREPAARFWSAAEMAATVAGSANAGATAAPTAVMAGAPATEMLWGPPPARTQVLTATEWDRPARHPAAGMLAVLAGLAVLTAVIVAIVAGHGGHRGSPATSQTTVPRAAPTTVPVTATVPPSTSTTPTTAPVVTLALPPGPGGHDGPGPGPGKKHH